MAKQHFYLLTSDKFYDTFEKLFNARTNIKYVAFSIDKKEVGFGSIKMIGEELVRLIMKT